MALDHSMLMAESARRGLRYQVLGVAATLALALLSIFAARANPVSAILVVLTGVNMVIIGGGLRANGALLEVVHQPQPRWVPWLVPATFVLGPLVAATGVWLLMGLVFSAP